MKILFSYRYGALGGVPTQLINRMQYLRGVSDVSVEFLFARDYGIAPALAPYGPMHIEPDAQQMRKLVAARRYDVVVVIDTEEYLEAVRNTDAAVVLEVHTTVETGLKYLEKTWNPAGYIVPSEYSRRMLSSRFGVANAEIQVVSNIIDPAIFKPEPAAGATRPIVLWVGRIDEHKNWEGFLEVGSLLSMVAPEVELWMVGGETAPEEIAMCMLETVEGLGLMRRFRWFPRIEYSAMPRLYAHVRESGGCSLVTSRDESFGMSIAESLLCGCPVVSSDVGAVAEIAPNKPYLSLYRPAELDEAAERVRRILFEDHRAVRRALEVDLPSLGQRFSPATIGPKYLEVLRSLAERRRSS